MEKHIPEELLERIARFPEKLVPLREVILANLAMVSQIPAPTGHEADRVQYLLDRFTEEQLVDVAPDEIGNAVGVLPGRVGERNIVVASHLDTVYEATEDHNVTIVADRATGRGVGDNSLGAAVVSCLPLILRGLGIELDANLILLGAIRSLGRGSLEGIRFHLDNLREPAHFGVVVEGMPLGRLNHFSVGMLRGDISCSVREQVSPYYGTESAIAVLNSIINRILCIAVPQRPFTAIRLGSIEAGKGYSTAPTRGELKFQVVSHSDEMIDTIRKQIEDIVAEVAARHGVDVELDCFVRQGAKGLPFSHPLVKSTLEILQALDIEPDQGFSPSELSAFLARDIPAVTIGITRGAKQEAKVQDYVLIEPITRGVAQLLGLLLAIDAGVCHDV